MGDDIGFGCVFFFFLAMVQLSKSDLDNNLSLNPNRCHHPLITQLSMYHLKISNVCTILIRNASNSKIVFTFRNSSSSREGS